LKGESSGSTSPDSERYVKYKNQETDKEYFKK